ncbi:hypothetical protein HPB48_012641 [Haemaphysalis longicornis]|uniref:ADAM10 cysteine-rich domain-containing protein n=1 Tax=Haemaphysalis longicornis TaxID=44386 RepID=A0A9J6FZA9_HAELO|nr:hypothetical protein HPB48_012641 [Haemaphysalis longicornis]
MGPIRVVNRVHEPGSECKEACHFERMRDLCHRRMEPGAACDDLRGYCDVFQRCRLIDSDGPLSRLHGLIFGEQGLTTPLLRYWYLTLLALVGTAVVTLAALRVCTVHISSSNPQRPPRRTLTDTVIHPLDFMKDFLHL